MKRRDETRRDETRRAGQTDARRGRPPASSERYDRGASPTRHTREGGQVTGPGGGAGYGLMDESTIRRRSASGRSAKQAGQARPGQSAQPHHTSDLGDRHHRLGGRLVPTTTDLQPSMPTRPSPTPTPTAMPAQREDHSQGRRGKNITDPHLHPPPNTITKQRCPPRRALAG